GRRARGARQRVRGQPAPQGLAAGESRAAGGQGAWRLDHRSRILGSIAAWKMSTARLAATYTRAMNRVTPRMAGVSRLVIEAVAELPRPGPAKIAPTRNGVTGEEANARATAPGTGLRGRCLPPRPKPAAPPNPHPPPRL